MKRLWVIILAFCICFGIGNPFSTFASGNSGLVYSTVYAWDADEMKEYNCYAYVLGLTDDLYEPGDFSGGSYEHMADMYHLALAVRNDLASEDLGYECIEMQNTCPTSMGGWENIIAVRKDTTLDYLGVFNDFHFAKMTSDGWYHKPGKTAVLKFNDPPSNDVAWTNESYKGRYEGATITYDSPIRYIMFNQNHNTLGYWTGDNYHSGTKHYYEYEYRCANCDLVDRVEWISLNCRGNGMCIYPWSLPDDPVTYEIK